MESAGKNSVVVLKPGTLCYLVNLVEMTDYIGRVVEVRSGPTWDPVDDEFKYTVDAPWVRERFLQGALAVRNQLRPIVPPDSLTPAARKRTAPEKTES